MLDKKFIIGIVLFTLLIIGGAIGFFSSSSQQANIKKTQGVKLEVSHLAFDFKNIPYNGGNVEHKFPIKNAGTGELQMTNIKTSCMCTTAILQTKEGKSPSFGMPGHGRSNLGFVGRLKPGEVGYIVVVFDPTAHGPEGIGPVSRLISFETNDPNRSYVELSISGTVIK